MKIYDNCKIGKNAMIGAGSVLKENTIIPEGELWVGSPA